MSWDVEFVGGSSLIWSQDMIDNSVSLTFKRLTPTTIFTSDLESTDTGVQSGLPYQRVVFNINFQKFYLRQVVIDSQDRQLYYDLMNLAANEHLWIKSIGSDSERFAELQLNERTTLHAGSYAKTITNIDSDGTVVILTSTGHGLVSGKWINTKDVVSSSVTVADGSYQVTYIDDDNISIIFVASVADEVATGTIAEIGNGITNFILPIQVVVPGFPQLEPAENLASDNFAITAESKGLYNPTIFT